MEGGRRVVMICCKSYSMGAGGCSGDSSGGRVDDGTAYAPVVAVVIMVVIEVHCGLPCLMSLSLRF